MQHLVEFCHYTVSIMYFFVADNELGMTPWQSMLSQLFV